MRHNGPLRHKATKELLGKAVKLYIPEGVSRMALEEQLAMLPDSTVVDTSAAASADAMEIENKVVESEEKKDDQVDIAPRTSVIPEVLFLYYS